MGSEVNNPFSCLAWVAEQKILEAQKNGEFENLPGAGKPLPIEDLSSVPEELRMAYKILKNAGCLPPELQERKDAANLLELLENCPDEKERVKQMARLRLLLTKIQTRAKRQVILDENDEYFQKILSRLEMWERQNDDMVKKKGHIS